jgi:hypothetical protein
MTFRLISHVNRDDDLIEAWVNHYLALGIASFHLIAHGGREENSTLCGLVGRYPIKIIDVYSGVFDPFEKRDRLAWGLAKLGSGWITLVDSDEFVEFPYRSLAATVKVMEWLRADSLSAPMLQRFASDGIVRVEGGSQPCDAYPWCSTDLYERLGQPQAVIDKYPLFRLQRQTWLRSGGNHYPPNGYGSRVASMRAVTHHFKWRPAVQDRMVRRAGSTHAYRGESEQYLKYLDQSAWRLPTEGAFRYSRRALFARGLLRRPSPIDLALRRATVVDTSNGRGSVFDVVMSPEHVASLLSRRGLKTTALCGAGSGGRVFLNALRQKNVSVTCVVDRDSSRWGSTFEGIPICALDQALEAGERTFVAASLVYGAEMKAQVEQRASELGVGVTVFAPLRPRGLSSC